MGLTYAKLFDELLCAKPLVRLQSKIYFLHLIVCVMCVIRICLDWSVEFISWFLSIPNTPHAIHPCHLKSKNKNKNTSKKTQFTTTWKHICFCHNIVLLWFFHIQTAYFPSVQETHWRNWRLNRLQACRVQWKVLHMQTVVNAPTNNEGCSYDFS